MVHHRQGLPFGLEARDDLPATHAGLDDLERDAAADRLGLLGHVDGAHASFADLLEQLVRTDDSSRRFRAGWLIDRRALPGKTTLKKAAGRGVSL
jgi:hypothetical protein